MRDFFLLYRWVIRKGIALSDVPVELDATLEVHFSTDSLPHLHKFIASSAQDSLPLLPFTSASAPFILSEHHLSIREGSGLSWVSSSGTLSGILPYVSQDPQQVHSASNFHCLHLHLLIDSAGCGNQTQA